MYFALTAGAVALLFWAHLRYSGGTVDVAAPVDLDLSAKDAREVVERICPDARISFTAEIEDGYRVGVIYEDGYVIESEVEITWSAAILNFIDILDDEQYGRRERYRSSD